MSIDLTMYYEQVSRIPAAEQTWFALLSPEDQQKVGTVPATATPEPQQTPFEQRAAILIDRGIPVAPLPPRTKKAALNNWESLATTDTEKLAQLHPDRDGNTAAVARAEIGGFCFFEVDKPNFHQQIEQETGQKFPATFMVSSSPGKGRGHFYFAHSEKSRALGNAQLADSDGEVYSFRADRRYVVGPQSVKETGEIYTVVNDAPIVPIPDWLVEYIAAKSKEKKQKTGHAELDSEEPIAQGGRNNALTSILGKARQVLAMDREQLYQFGLSLNEKRCRPPLSETEVRTIADSVGGYAVKPTGKIEFPASTEDEKVRADIVRVQKEREEREQDLSWLDSTEAAARPVFPEWVMRGTSLYEGLAKPVSDVNSKFPELIWMPAVQLMLNFLYGKVGIKGMKVHTNMFLGQVSSPGKFFKSSSCKLGHEYFQQMGLVKSLHPGLKNSEGKIVIGQAGSSEGFGLQMYNARTTVGASHGILFNDELGKLMSKAGIENSSLPHDLLTWYESNAFDNPVKSRQQSFAFPAGTYCFGWQFCTTIRGFNSQWPRIAGIASGLPDRTFFVVTPENPKPLSIEVAVNTVEGSIRTKNLIDKAIDGYTLLADGTNRLHEYEIDDFAQQMMLEKSAAFGDPRSMNMVYKFALYFCIDLDRGTIDDDCIKRALALVEYRQQAIAFLQPIEAKNDEGRLLQEMLRELRQHGGKMARRDFVRALHYEEYGDRFWNTVYVGAVKADRIREFTEPGARGQTRKMIGIVKDDVRFGPE